MFRTNGQADGVWFNVLLFQLFLGKLAVGGGSRMDDKALHIRHIGQKGEHLQAVNKSVGLFFTALYLKGKNRSPAFWEIFLIQFVVRVSGQGGMVHLFHQGMAV